MFVVPPLGGVYVSFSEHANLLWRLGDAAKAAKAAKRRPLKWELRTLTS